MQIPGGYLARKLGGATMIGVVAGSSGALTLLTPLAARTHVGMLIALRVVMGLTEVRTYALVSIELFSFFMGNFRRLIENHALREAKKHTKSNLRRTINSCM